VGIAETDYIMQISDRFLNLLLHLITDELQPYEYLSSSNLVSH
jgi:hypothetical protein